MRGGWQVLVCPWHLDEPIEGFPVPIGAMTLTDTGPADTEHQRLIQRYGALRDAVASVARPLLLAGDCLAALGLVAGLQSRHADLGIVWLDAHADFNTPQITVSGYLAGMSLAMLTGRSPEPLSEALGVRPVREQNVVLMGARDLDPAERDALAASQVQRVAPDPETFRSVVDLLAGTPVYLHIDVDIVDGSDLPGLRFPAGAGPTLSRVEECVTEIVAVTQPVAACIACTWSPERIGHEATQRAITRLARVIGAGLRWPASGAAA